MRYGHHPIVTSDLPVSFTMDNGSPPERVEPITLDMAKQHLRVDSASDDTLIAAFIAAAREYWEEQTGRQAIDATWEYALDQPPIQRFIELPRPPLSEVTAILYTDTDGNEQTFDAANYVVVPSFFAPAEGQTAAIQPHCLPGRVELVSGASWPTVLDAPRSLRIRRMCGYGPAAADMPGTVRASIQLLVGHFHRNRAEVSSADAAGSLPHVLPLGAQVLIDAFKWTAVVMRPPVSYARRSTEMI